MHKSTVGAYVLLGVILVCAPALAQLKKIRFSTTSIAVTEMQFRIAHERVLS